MKQVRFWNVCSRSRQLRALGRKGLTWAGRKGKEFVAAGESFGVFSFRSNVSTPHAAPSNIELPRFTTELFWSRHHFYINRFFEESALRGNQVYD